MNDIFNFTNADDFRNKLVSGLNFPFVSCSISTLGGRENISCILTISTEAKETWANGILENSQYARVHISKNGIVEHFSGWKLKLRKFTGKNLDNIIEKINNIKRV
jgi:hypothetical protein